METEGLIIIRGGGDIATGTICRLHRCGFRLLILETARPQAIRRTVSLCEAVYETRKTVEDTTAVRVGNLSECQSIWQENNIPLLVDPRGDCIQQLQPRGLVDAILAKNNCTTRKSQAEITIGVGPGFSAGKDVHAVIETARGHDLSRVIFTGSAQPNTGIPGSIHGFAEERVLYAPGDGLLTIIQDIGRAVHKGDLIARIGDIPVTAPLTGIVRGLIRNQFEVRKGMKIADIDPRTDEPENYLSISDKARAVSGGVVEALLYFMNRRSR